MALLLLLYIIIFFILVFFRMLSLNQLHIDGSLDMLNNQHLGVNALLVRVDTSGSKPL